MSLILQLFCAIVRNQTHDQEYLHYGELGQQRPPKQTKKKLLSQKRLEAHESEMTRLVIARTHQAMQPRNHKLNRKYASLLNWGECNPTEKLRKPISSLQNAFLPTALGQWNWTSISFCVHVLLVRCFPFTAHGCSTCSNPCLSASWGFSSIITSSPSISFHSHLKEYIPRRVRMRALLNRVSRRWGPATSTNQPTVTCFVFVSFQFIAKKNLGTMRSLLTEKGKNQNCNTHLELNRKCWLERKRHSRSTTVCGLFCLSWKSPYVPFYFEA